jgi:superfamily II DNA helicase RecQ
VATQGDVAIDEPPPPSVGLELDGEGDVAIDEPPLPSVGLELDGLKARAVAALEALGRPPYTHQCDALAAQERGRDVLLCAATGGGKSAAYQAAAYAAPGTLTVVVSPLVELIREQTERTTADLAALARLGEATGHARCSPHTGPPRGGGTAAAAHGAAATAHDDDADDESAAAPLDAPKLREGTLAHAVVQDADLRIIYITPEELAAKDGKRWTTASAALQWALGQCERPLRAWVYDEVHLVDRWGSTFRDAYAHLSEACASVDATRRAAGRQPQRAVRVGVTATLTRGQAARLGTLVGMRDFETVFGGDHARANLHLAVRHATAAELHGGGGIAEAAAGLALLREALGGMLPPAAFAGRVMLYVSHAVAAPAVAEAITDARLIAPDGRRIAAVAYSGAMDTDARRAALAEWESNASVLVSTCAAGAGMDPPHEVTLVGHVRLPPSLLDLWQEWGRAGRRGRDAWCVLSVSPTFVTQTLHFASKQLEGVREQLVQELVEVLALAMLPGCRRRLLEGLLCGSPPAAHCASCDACVSAGVCGLWVAGMVECDATGVACVLLDALAAAPAPALTLSVLIRSPPTGVLPADIVVRVRLLLMLVADGALRFVWESSSWRLRVDPPSHRALRLASRRVRLSLPTVAAASAGLLDERPTSSTAERRCEALDELHRAHVAESAAQKRARAALREYLMAGGELEDSDLRVVMARRE